MQRKIRKKLLSKKLIITLGISLSVFSSVLYLDAPTAWASEAPVIKTILVKDITYSGNTKMSNEQIRGLLPELKKSKVDVDTLSRQIQLANDTGAVILDVNFQMDNTGSATAVVTGKEGSGSQSFISMDNSGNKQTGDYRTTFTYIDPNISGKADTFALSYTTSPDHLNDVKQSALFYRTVLPKENDSIYMYASHSDVNMGRVAQLGSFGINATGKGSTFGLHYQKNLAYQPSHRQFIDFGIDRQRFDNSEPIYDGSGTMMLDAGSGKVDTTLLNAVYNESLRSKEDAFSYSLGYTMNVGGSQTDYDRIGSEKDFGIVKYGLNYQHKYPNNWVLNCKVNGQLTHDNLISQAKLGAGGVNTVRGFVESAIQADSGILGSIELYTPEIAKGQRMLLFTDYAQLNNNDPQSGVFGSTQIASVGLGWRYGDKNGWGARVDYGYVIEGKDHNLNHDQGRLHFALSKKL